MGKMSKKYKTAKQGKALGGSDYSSASRRTIAKGAYAGTNAASTGAVKTVPGNPNATGMGVKKGKGQMPGSNEPGFAAGRSRTRRGKNSTTAGPQGFRG